ncbi:MAG: hypothetical protein H6987_18660 [Pseudomonadales bacterium]|nr:hypothetical protein [Pseudomonadales bacterium]
MSTAAAIVATSACDVAGYNIVPDTRFPRGHFDAEANAHSVTESIDLN